MNEQKHLGLVLESKLSCERHVNEKIKAKEVIGIIKYLSKFLPLKTPDQMYKTLVRSRLDYCDIIYHIPALNSQSNLGVTLNLLMEKVERTQCQAALAITAILKEPLNNRYSKLYLEKYFCLCVGSSVMGGACCLYPRSVLIEHLIF